MTNFSEAERWFQRGQGKFNNEDFSGALGDFQRAIQIKPDYAIAYFYYGKTFARLQNHKDAVEKYREAHKLKPDDVDILFNWGSSLESLQDYDNAIKKYRKAYRLEPDDADIYFNWGNALESLQRYNHAIEKYKKATEINPDHAVAFLNWGLALDKTKRYEDAIEKYKKATEINKKATEVNPDYAVAFLNWGLALDKTKRYEDAIEKYKKAIEYDQKNVYAYLGWADALQSLQDYTKAIEKYRKIILEINSENIPAYVNWGIALEKLYCYESAIKKYKTITEEYKYKIENNYKSIDKKDREYINKAFLRWANLLILLNIHEKSLEIYERAIALNLKSLKMPEIYFGYGLVLASLNRYEESIEQYKQAIEIDPTYPYPYHNIATYFWQRGDYQRGWKYWKKAFKAYKKAVEKEKYNNTPDLYYHFGYLLHEILGELNEAENIYLKGLDLNENNIILLSALVDVYREKKNQFNLKKPNLSENILLKYWSDEKQIEDKNSCHWKEKKFYNRALALMKQKLNYLNLEENNKIENLSDDESSSRELNIKLEKVRILISTGELNLKVDKHLESEKYFKQALDEYNNFEEKKAQAIDIASSDIDSTELAFLHSSLGILASKNLNFFQAVQSLLEARRVCDFEDLNIWSNLAEIYLRSGNLETAEQEYRDILRISSYHLDSQIGLSEVYIEMADDKDIDAYREAINCLTTVIQMSKSNRFLYLNQSMHCPRLRPKERANVFYSRGYARVKLYEKSGITGKVIDLKGALRDFRQCLRYDSKNLKAEKAIDKIEQKLDHFVPQKRLVGVVGPTILFIFSSLVFGLSQYGFWNSRFRLENSNIQIPLTSQKDTDTSSPTQEPQKSTEQVQETDKASVDETSAESERLSINEAQYALLTFGSLTFMMVSLYLPQIITLKVPGIELEKSPIDQTKSAGPLEIKKLSDR